MKDYLKQKDIEDFRKHSHYKVGDRITYELFFARHTGTIVKVTYTHFRPSDKKEIPFHYKVKGDTDPPGATPDIVFPKDILTGPTVLSRPMNVYRGEDRMVGSVDTSGNIYNQAHTKVGSVDTNGSIYDRAHTKVGSVDTSGNIYNQTHTKVGSVDYLGVVSEHTNRVIGSITGIHGGTESINFAGGAGLLLLLT